MDPIRSRTPSPARELLPGPQPDGVEPTADRGVSPPAGGPLDGLPARRTMSRTRLPSPPAPLPAHHTEAASAEWDEVQSGLRATDDPPPTVRVAVTAARPPRSRRRDGVLRNPATRRRPRGWKYARSATASRSKRRSNRRLVRQWRSTTRHWWAMGLHTRTSLRSANTRQR